MIEQVIDKQVAILKKAFHYSDEEYRAKDIEKYLTKLAQAIVDLSKHECEWEEVSRIPYHYKTGCGATSNYGPYKLFEQGDKFCPYCGGEIKEKS